MFSALRLYLYFTFSFEVIADLLVIVKNKIINSRQILVMMSDFVSKNLAELFVIFFSGEITVNLVETAVIKDNISAKRITFVLSQYKKIVVNCFGMDLYLRKQTHTA